MKANWRDRWTDMARCVCQGANAMIGIPDYETYVEHMRRTHPDRHIMTYPEFFQDRQSARYAGSRNGGFRCC